MVMIAVLAVSCSNLPKERYVDASNVEVSGFVKDYIEVVDGTYKFTNDGEEGRITVKVKLVKTPTEAYHSTYTSRLRINAVSEDGEIFDTGVYGFSAQYKEFDKIKDLLETGKIGDTKSVSFTWQYLGQDKDLASRIFNEATTFELIDDGFEIGEEPVNETKWQDVIENTEEGEDYDAITEEHRLNEEGNVTNKTKSEGDYDKWLDDYEAYFNTLVELNKKVKNGDTSAYMEYAELLEKANAISSRLYDAEGLMTPAQIARLYSIIQKYSREIQQ